MIEIINELLVDQEQFYQSSFKASPEKCMPFVVKILAGIESLQSQLDERKMATLKNIVQRMAVAMEGQDYVLLRDCLQYEMKSFLESLQKRQKRKNAK